MAFSSADIDAVDAAIMALARGERATEVDFSDGSRVRYAEADLTKLQQLRSFIASTLPATPGSDPTQQAGGVTYAEWGCG